MSKKQNGFSLPEVLLVIAIILAIGLGGWLVYQRQNINPNHTQQPEQKSSNINRDRLGCGGKEIQLIVNFKSGITKDEAMKTIENVGDTYLYIGGSTNDPSYVTLSQVKDDGGDVDALVERAVMPYQKLPIVDYAEIDGCAHITN